MAMRGVAIERIARMLGHSDPRVTWKTYAKVQPGLPPRCGRGSIGLKNQGCNSDIWAMDETVIRGGNCWLEDSELH
jgi:hypothetical protein